MATFSHSTASCTTGPSVTRGDIHGSPATTLFRRVTKPKTRHFYIFVTI